MTEFNRSNKIHKLLRTSDCFFLLNELYFSPIGVASQIEITDNMSIKFNVAVNDRFNRGSVRTTVSGALAEYLYV